MTTTYPELKAVTDGFLGGIAGIVDRMMAAGDTPEEAVAFVLMLAEDRLKGATVAEMRTFLAADKVLLDGKPKRADYVEAVLDIYIAPVAHAAAGI